MFGGIISGTSKNTSPRLVLPFYIYGAIAFLAAAVLLFTSADAFLQHHFHPRTLAITHIMALGWGTMMILGASHQLVPVLIEGKMYSEKVGYVTFLFAATGIPMLVISFYLFRFDWLAQWGGILINIAILLFLFNLIMSMAGSKKENIHAVFIFTATLWLFITVLLGLFLIYNFTHNLLAFDSLHYLPLHAHMGIAGWFLLLVLGVGSRLIPMFLISKYDNPRLLWWIYGLINTALIGFLVIFQYRLPEVASLIPTLMLFSAVVLFAIFCYQSWKNRLRKKVDDQLKISLLSIAMIAIPVIILILILAGLTFFTGGSKLVLLYGFCIFFGWITAIILGMSFKTLPFILWSKKFSALAGKGKTPSPKDLFSDRIFRWMTRFYLAGFLLFCVGVALEFVPVIQFAAALILVCAILYNVSIFKMFTFKRSENE